MFAFEDRTLAILAAVGDKGSVSAAARTLGLDPSNAMRHIRTAEARVGAILVRRARGGAGGGTAALTPEARRMLRASRTATGTWHARLGAYDAETGTTPAEAAGRAFAVAGRHPAGLARITWRPADVTLARRSPQGGSARNLVAAQVDAITPHTEGTYLVTLVAGTFRFAAALTRGALRELRLRPGSRVVASWKASAIVVLP